MAAADRLSDFITVASRRKTTDEKKGRDQARDKLPVSGVRIGSDALQEAFKSIEKLKEARNEAVHRLATEPARVQRRLIAADREAFEKKSWTAPSNREAPYENFTQGQNFLDAKALVDVEVRAKLLCDCYLKLVKMGELSFRTENNGRDRAGGET
jgi:hypothetical protein